MSRTVTYSLVGAILVGVSILLLVFALQSHREYIRAHVAASRVLRAASNSSTLPGSPVAPEPFFRRAQWSALGVCAIAVTAMVAAIRTRHLAWLACFLVCGVLAAVAVINTGIRI